MLALDTGGTTGWATNARGLLESGKAEFPHKRGSSPGVRFLEFRQWVETLIADLAPQLVVYEQAHHRGGWATEFGVGLTTRVQEAAAAAGVEYRGVHSSTLKRFAAGDGRAEKGAMQAAARERFPWYDAAADPGADEADALWLLAFALAGFPAAAPKTRKKEAQAARKRPGPQPTLGLGR